MYCHLCHSGIVSTLKFCQLLIHPDIVQAWEESSMHQLLSTIFVKEPTVKSATYGGPTDDLFMRRKYIYFSILRHLYSLKLYKVQSKFKSGAHIWMRQISLRVRHIRF